MNANSTHPDAKPRDERERDALTWGVAFDHPIRARAKVWIVNLNGETVAGPLDRLVAGEIVRLHNQAL